MTLDGEVRGALAVPPGYELDLCTDDSVIVARIFSRDGNLAASGYAAGAEGVFIYDRIITEEPHRRRGLASAIVKALSSRRHPADARQALVATQEGRALYTRLGWMIRSPWTTAVIRGAPSPAQGGPGAYRAAATTGGALRPSAARFSATTSAMMVSSEVRGR